MNDRIYREKVMGCWLGKAVGGTLGQPFEGCDGPMDLSFYDPVPTDMVPNDDLDLQVLWCCVMDRMEHPAVDRKILADAWLNHVDFPWDEYGIAIRNLKMGIPAPFSGSYDNWFKTDSAHRSAVNCGRVLPPAIRQRPRGMLMKTPVSTIPATAFMRNSSGRLRKARHSRRTVWTKSLTAVSPSFRQTAVLTGWSGIPGLNAQGIILRWKSGNIS